MEGKLVCNEGNEGMSLKISQTHPGNSQIIFSTDSPDKTELVLGDNFEVQIKDNKTYIVRKQPQYPQTYEECCEVLNYEPDRQTVTGYDAELIENLQTLKLCRDAYWKIAGEQMGLGEPWEPDWKDDSDKYFICYLKDELWVSNIRDCNRLLVFPTEEMRDAFYENFKELIEQCKELL